mgnify:CR=1 FL=1
MNATVFGVFSSVVFLIVGLLVGYLLRKTVGESRIGSAEQKAQNLILDAENAAENIKKEKILEAKEETHRLKSDLENEIRDRRKEVEKSERRILQREENIEKKLENIERREDGLSKRERSMNEKHQKIDEYLAKQVEELEKISGYTQEEAKQILLDEVEKDIRKDASARWKRKRRTRRTSGREKSSPWRFSAVRQIRWRRPPFRWFLFRVTI